MQKWEGKLIFQTIGKQSLHNYSDDNGIRLINFAISINLVIKSNKGNP